MISPTLLSYFAAGAPGQCIHKFLGLQPWYAYLPSGDFDGSCNITSFNFLGGNSDIILIILAIIDDLLILAGILAVGFVLYGGFRYVTSHGSPDGTSKAQSTIMNALIGLGLALVSAQFVSYIATKLAGNAGQGPNGGGQGLDLSVLPDLGGSVTGGGIIQTILTIVFNVIGALAFLFIILGGFNYVTAQGDPQKTSQAKSTILFALVGLVVAIVAQSIVSFILTKL